MEKLCPNMKVYSVYIIEGYLRTYCLVNIGSDCVNRIANSYLNFLKPSSLQ
jgi:hypothetical protein